MTNCHPMFGSHGVMVVVTRLEKQSEIFVWEHGSKNSTSKHGSQNLQRARRA